MMATRTFLLRAVLTMVGAMDFLERVEAISTPMKVMGDE
jgi:hypothetical protein